jgi:hypothetical protein
MGLELKVGLNSMAAYRRLPYTAWHAIAEFVDNSTQSYLNHKDELDASYGADGDGLDVSVTYDRKKQTLAVADNAMGMSLEELARALNVGLPPENPNGRSKYGLGMKTAASWLGPRWSIRTTRLGDPNEYVVHIDMAEVEKGNADLDLETRPVDPTKHHTIIEITDLYKQFGARGLAKIKRRLSSMYRKDFEALGLTLRWQGEVLTWGGFEGQLLTDRENRPYRQDFDFQVDGLRVHGWGGILFKGARSDAGFSILQHSRVIKGWPDAWRPFTIFGDARNDLINQRIVGEIHLDGFDVSHTKDDIHWSGDQEEEVEEKLAEELGDLVSKAKTFRKGAGVGTGGPSAADVDKAVTTIEGELTSDEMLDEMSFDDIPDPTMLRVSLAHISEQVKKKDKPAISATVGKIKVVVYLARDLSPNDPYVILDSAVPEEVIIVINMSHPFVLTQVEGEDGVLNYLRHCIYDAVAEARAHLSEAEVTPETVKMFKDLLLRVPFKMIQNEPGEEGDAPLAA